MQNLRNDGTYPDITTRNGRVLPKLHLIYQTYVDNVVFEDENIIDDINLKGGPAESEKLKDIGEKKVIVGSLLD